MCLAPVTNKHKMHVPCGTCYKCVKYYQDSWIIRILHETDNSTSAFIATLTYDEAHVPRSEKNFDELHIDYTDIQKLLKRIRKNTKKEVKYFIVPQYGDKNGRPHYHAIMWNIQPEDLINNWYKGHCDFDVVNAKGIRYAMRYILRDVRKKNAIDDRNKDEILRMSKGIGKCWIQKHKEYYLKNPHIQTIVKDGRHYPIPRFYRNLIGYDPKTMTNIKLKATEMKDKPYQKKNYNYRMENERKKELFYNHEKLKKQKIDSIKKFLPTINN